MTNTATFDKLRLLKLHGMERAFQGVIESRHDQDLTIEEFMAHLVESEWTDRQNRKTRRLTQAAGFRSRAAFQEVDFTVQRGLDRKILMRLSDCSWVTEARSIIVAGPTGVGKSFIAQALGAQACALGHRTLYFNCSKLFQAFKDRRNDGSFRRFMNRIARTPLLILDDFGLAALDVHDRLSLLEIVEDRHGRSATIIASQLPVARWFEMIGDPTIADAICDRLVHQAVRLNLTGVSMRAKQAEKQPESLLPDCINPATTLDSV